MKVVVVVQARVGSSRLPGKVLLPVAGHTLLEHQIARVRAATEAFELVVATTTDPADEAIARLSSRAGVSCYRGHPHDLLDRHYRVACAERADVVVKVPSDCPLIDPRVIDRVIGRYREMAGQVDYVSNLHPATYPDGNDVEAMKFSALEAAFLEARRPFEREHTTPFIWERPQRFRLENVLWETGQDYSMTHRWTLDYPEDYQFVRAVYDRLWSASRPIFAMNDILSLLDAEPALSRINARYVGVNWYRHHLHELRSVSAAETRTHAEGT